MSIALAMKVDRKIQLVIMYKVKFQKQIQVYPAEYNKLAIALDI